MRSSQVSVRWMAGYRADLAHEGRWAEPLSCRSFAAPERSVLQHEDAFGAIGLFGFLGSEREGMRYDVVQAWDLALEWRGDSLRIYYDEEAGQTALVWQVRLSHRDFAAELADIARARDASWHVRRHGREVRIFAATEPGLARGWGKQDLCHIRTRKITCGKFLRGSSALRRSGRDKTEQADAAK